MSRQHSHHCAICAVPGLPALAEPRLVRVENLVVGARVDLQSCPFLKEHAMASFEFAVVVGIERESANCVAVSYEGIDTVGYPVGTELTVCTPVAAQGCGRIRKMRQTSEDNYVGEDGYGMRREYGDDAEGNALSGRWVLRGPDAEWVDSDESKQALMARNGFVSA